MSDQVGKVSNALLSGIYVKAQNLDCGHNAQAASEFAPLGTTCADAVPRASVSCASAHTGNAQFKGLLHLMWKRVQALMPATQASM